jgi:hypothetical protein
MAHASIGNNSAIPGHDRNTEMARARHDQPVCQVPVQERSIDRDFGVNEASLMPGPAINRANQVFGSGMNRTARLRPAEGLLSSPTSHAEIGETNIPSAAPSAGSLPSPTSPWGRRWPAKSLRKCPAKLRWDVCSGSPVYRTRIGGEGFAGDGRRQINLGRNDDGSPQKPV